MKFPSLAPKSRKTVALPLATAIVVGTFFVFQKSSTRNETLPPSGADSSVFVESTPAETAGAVGPNQTNSTNPTPSRSAMQGPKATERKTACWSAEFKIDGELKAAQKANFGERDQVLDLFPLVRLYPKWTSARLCVRSQGRAVAFDRDPASEDRIRIRAGSGRIRPDSRIEVSYCSNTATGCAPCTVAKDEFEGSLFGESAEDTAENDDADLTAQLSPEVRRELARLERDAAPAPITSWSVVETGTSCGKPEVRVAKVGGLK
jgi:hypothetical protein